MKSPRPGVDDARGFFRRANDPLSTPDIRDRVVHTLRPRKSEFVLRFRREFDLPDRERTRCNNEGGSRQADRIDCAKGRRREEIPTKRRTTPIDRIGKKGVARSGDRTKGSTNRVLHPPLRGCSGYRPMPDPKGSRKCSMAKPPGSASELFGSSARMRCKRPCPSAATTHRNPSSTISFGEIAMPRIDRSPFLVLPPEGKRPCRAIASAGQTPLWLKAPRCALEPPLRSRLRLKGRGQRSGSRRSAKGCAERFGAIGEGTATGLTIRHDNGSQYVSQAFLR